MFELDNTFYDNVEDILCEIEFVKSKKRLHLANVASVFDIEASSFYMNNEKCACMYAWVFGIDGRCVRGRTWDEFSSLINKVVERYNLSLHNRHLVVYVHNLSYEFQFMKQRFEWDCVFSVEARKPLYAITTSGIEFRCSYLLSGYSLANLGKNLLKYKVNKLVGDLDYDKLRHTQTPLTDTEWGYILNDGLVVMAHIQEEIERLGRITKLPLTKTGYVRDICREKTLKGENKYIYSNFIRSLTMTPENYKQLKRAFAGGFTHANHSYVGKVVDGVTSFDETSAYPSVMVSEKFPMSSAYPVNVKSLDHFYELLDKYCCLFDIKFTNIRPKIDYEHYISRSKCYVLEDYKLDNGRVIEASSLAMTITEQDFFIIDKCYMWDKIEVANFNTYVKDYLPKDLIQCVLNFYKDKTSLKGVEGKEVDYMVSKGMLNSTYGMCVTDPCKDENIYDNLEGWKIEKMNLLELIEAYNGSRSRFLYYPWGVWVTAYARSNLWSAIFELKDDYIYSDTDSVKFINYENHKDYFENYNKEIEKKIKNCLNRLQIPVSRAFPKTIKNEVKPLGVWDYEGRYKFKTLGAKRYIYVDEKDKLHITISGVSKSSGVTYLKYKYKTYDKIFKNFKEGIEFPANYINNGVNTNASGKLCHTYIDEYMGGEITDYLGNTHYFSEYSAIHMEATSYVLSLDALFLAYIMGDRSVFC